ncbi:alpha/beta hydrolase family protein [Bosea sp. (in: a-proteobacteria)]|jgi:predicted esterase|uniref:alpha/beta hydrolase family protein n=1 Tax=Bosea sp. (in: a-proteobacteria) TaxID=1871050 RepID=UPI0035691D5D
MMRSSIWRFLVICFLVSGGPANACSGEDNCAAGLVVKHYSSTGPAQKTLAVFLHGDVSAGGSADYMLSSAQRFVADVPGAHAVVMLRPGYFDRNNVASEGSDCGRRNCYTEGVIRSVSAAIAEVKMRYGAKTVLGFGHSGGSAILANVLASSPGLMTGAILTSCPCDIRSWKRSWSNSLSPLDVVGRIPSSTKVVAVTGRDDSNTVPAIAERYVAALKAAGKDGTMILVDGTHDYRSVRSSALEQLKAMAAR